MNTRAEINGTEKSRTIERNQWNKKMVLWRKKINKIDKPLARLRKRKENTQIVCNNNEMKYCYRFSDTESIIRVIKNNSIHINLVT